MLFSSPLTTTTAATSPQRDISKISATPWSEELHAPGGQRAQGMGFVKLPFLCRARVRVSSSQLCSLGTRLPLPSSLPPAGEIRREERCHWRPDCVINMQEGMWELRANPRGPGGGRLISPSALPLPGILFCLFLCLSLGPDPVNEINEVRAEIFSVQDTSGLWPFPWL